MFSVIYCPAYPLSWQEIRPVHPIMSLEKKCFFSYIDIFIHQSSCAPVSLWILKQPEIRTWTLRIDLCSFETFLLKGSQARLHYLNVSFQQNWIKKYSEADKASIPSSSHSQASQGVEATTAFVLLKSHAMFLDKDLNVNLWIILVRFEHCLCSNHFPTKTSSVSGYKMVLP